ncbi:hypothetical protein TIFTF001_054118 [Ficus carica]|uniref:Uncharacterized protein n=1 Tax=Ficus carica TaxID=3494 RepID=A0AA88JET1_FICCA|nr:hypothetical protein TIFTF001_054118 [Ficus carica]
MLKQPPAKKLKASEKTAKKEPGKRKNEQDKAIALESSNDPQVTEEEEEADVEIQGHLDEFSWDGLKCILKEIGLIYRSTDKAVERRVRIRELKATDRKSAEKLLDIERKFKDACTSADDVIKEFHTLNGKAKKGAEMMKSMVDRFDKATAENDALRESIEQKEGDIAGLITRTVGEYEKATFKARYELLKEYKQGLLVDVDAAEEIELNKKSLAEAEASTSAPRTTVEPSTSAVSSTTDKLNPAAFKR